MILSPGCREALKWKTTRDIFYNFRVLGEAYKLTVDIYAANLLFKRSRVDLAPAKKAGLSKQRK